MTSYIGFGKDARVATARERRQALKAYVLNSLSIVVSQETWESWDSAAEELGVSEEDLDKICDEICDELRRRSNKLPYIPVRAVLP